MRKENVRLEERTRLAQELHDTLSRTFLSALDATYHGLGEHRWGLAGMQERATRIGGLLKISSSATAGAEVELSIPSGIAFQLSPMDQSA